MTGGDRHEARDTAIRLLASREHSREELRRKLLSDSIDAESLERLLDELQREGLQSDERYVEQYLHVRKRKGYGPLRIRQELSQKGIPGELIHAWVDEGEHDWRALMEDVARRKFGSSPPKDFRESSRRARFLEYRGFPTDLIRAFLWTTD